MAREDAALQWFTGMNALDVDAALSGFRDDAGYLGMEWRDGAMVRRLYSGRDEVRGYLAAFLGSLETLEYTKLRVGVEPDAVLVEWTDAGRSREGHAYANRGVLVFDLDADGKVTEARSYFDYTPLTTQKFLEDR